MVKIFRRAGLSTARKVAQEVQHPSSKRDLHEAARKLETTRTIGQSPSRLDTMRAQTRTMREECRERSRQVVQWGGWEAGIRTPIRRSRVCSLTVRRHPKRWPKIIVASTNVSGLT